jgi:hypothetical protein
MRFMIFLSTFESCHRNTHRILLCENAVIRSLAAAYGIRVIVSSAAPFASEHCGKEPAARACGAHDPMYRRDLDSANDRRLLAQARMRPEGKGFAGQAVGVNKVHDDIWLVSFMDYDLGYFDLETRVLEPLENPFGPKVSPM